MRRTLLQRKRQASAWGSPPVLRLTGWLTACAACAACMLVLDRALRPGTVHRPAEVASASALVDAAPRPSSRRTPQPPPVELRGSVPAVDATGSTPRRVRRALSSNVVKAFESAHWGERRLVALAEVLETPTSAAVRSRVVDEMARLVVRHRAGMGAELARLLEARVAALDDPRLAYRLQRSLAR